MSTIDTEEPEVNDAGSFNSAILNLMKGAGEEQEPAQNEPPAPAEPERVPPAEPAAPAVPAPAEPVPAATPQSGEEPLRNPNFTPDAIEIAEKPPGDAGKKAVDTWKDLRATAQHAQSQLAQQTVELERLRSELEDLKKAPPAQTPKNDETRAELARAKAELEALQKHLKAADYTRTPEYASKVKEPEAQIRTTIKDIATANDSSEKALWEVITESDPRIRAKKIDEIGENFTTAEKLELAMAAREYQRVQNVKTRLESEAETLWSENQSRSQREQEEKIRAFREEQSQKNVNAFKRLQETSPYLKRVAGADKWNAALDATEQWLRDVDFDSLSTDEAGALAASARALPYVEAALNQVIADKAALVKERDQLKAEVARITAASPGVGDGAQRAPKVEAEPPRGMGTFDAGFAKEFGLAG